MSIIIQLRKERKKGNIWLMQKLNTSNRLQNQQKTIYNQNIHVTNRNLF